LRVEINNEQKNVYVTFIKVKCSINDAVNPSEWRKNGIKAL